MNIAIDANIIRQDLKLKDKDFEIISDYLLRTASSFVLPQIVFEESCGLYKKHLTDGISEFKTAYGKLNSALSLHQMPPVKKIEIDKEVEAYQDFLLKKLKLNKGQIIAYKNDYLPELVTRAIERKKPLDGNGQQFRDGLLWLTLLDHASTLKDKRLVFISNNHKDFSENSRNELNKVLQAEAESRKVTILYYKTLSDFIREHTLKVDFITDQWIKENVDISKLEEIFNQFIPQAKEDVLEQARSSLRENETATGYINPTPYINSSLLDRYVYEMTDGTILLNLEVEFEKEYEFEVERERVQEHFSSLADKAEFERFFRPRAKDEIPYGYDFIYPIFRANFVITIKEGKITEYEFKDWDSEKDL